MFALEQLQVITTKQAETPHEEWFQKVYSTVIENALNTLTNPDEPSKPQKSWAPFRQVSFLLLCDCNFNELRFKIMFLVFYFALVSSTITTEITKTFVSQSSS